MMKKQINKTCSCGKIIKGSIRKRYCPECLLKSRKLTSRESNKRFKFRLPNTCNICGNEIPKFKHKCKQCLGYKKTCYLCNKDFQCGKKHQRFCSHECAYQSLMPSQILENISVNQKYQELIKKYEALQYSYKLLEAVDDTNVLLLDKYRNENELFKKELEWIKSTGDNNECS